MYYYNYGYPMTTYNTISDTTIALIAAGVAALVGIILFFTFLRKKNEGRFHGFANRLYHFLNFNRFYTEDICRFLYVITVFAVTVGGIAFIVMGKFLVGAGLIVCGNIAARLVFELIIICMVLVRRVVSMDRKLSKIEKFYEDDYADWEDRACGGNDEEDEEGCSGYCASCQADCSPEYKKEHEIKNEKMYSDYNKEYNPSVIYAGHIEKEKLSAPSSHQEAHAEPTHEAVKESDDASTFESEKGEY